MWTSRPRRSAQAGGRIFRGPLNARKDLRVAVVADAQGAPLGPRQPRSAISPDERPPALNRWLWMEYVARDPAAALKFYGEVVGFGHEIYEHAQNFTYYLLTTDRPRAGLFRSPWERETSAWLPYVRVADPAAMAARAVGAWRTRRAPAAAATCVTARWRLWSIPAALPWRCRSFRSSWE